MTQHSKNRTNTTKAIICRPALQVILVCILPFLVILTMQQPHVPVSAQAIFTPTPPPPPYTIDAPWPAGIVWEAGGQGSFYGDFHHQNADYYAIDFNAPENNADAGTLVLAAADGKVVDADCDDNGTYGCRVVIGHPADETYCYETQYAHLQNDLLITENDDYVSRGQPIGRVGHTGLTGNPPPDHLHFSIHRRPLAECNSTERANRKDMAVVPDPLGGTTPITDGLHMTSSTYSVGYEAFTDAQIHRGAGLPVHHGQIAELYRKSGGSFGQFGSPLGPVLPFSQGTYQEFGPYELDDELPWYGLSSTIVESNNQAFFLYKPIWDEYFSHLGDYGKPLSSSYNWDRIGPGFRNDFDSQTSIVWSQSSGIEVFRKDDSDMWSGKFWPHPNSFDDSDPYERPDKYLDFSWSDSSKPGPITEENGFSAKWETTVNGFINIYRIALEYQGHIEIKVDGKSVLKRSSPDRITSEESSIQFGIGSENVEVLYWQEGNKAGRIQVIVIRADIFPRVFASEGEIKTNISDPPEITYASFEPALRDNVEPYPELGECPIKHSEDVKLHEVEEENEITAHVLCIDLTDPYLRFQTVMANDVLNVNPPGDQRESVVSMVSRAPYQERHPIAAFNADYFGSGHGAEGFTVVNGLRIDGPYSNDNDGNETGRVSQAFSRLNQVYLGFRGAEEVSNLLLHQSAYYNATGGGPTLVRDGRIIPDPCPPEGFRSDDECRQAAQTAVGLSPDGKTLIVVVGEQDSNNVGYYNAEGIARLLVEYGANNGIKLDGGSSSQLWYRGETIKDNGGVANAILVFREEIPRHNASLASQGPFPVVQPGASITLSMTLQNTGFLDWDADLPYGLKLVGGENLGLASWQPVPATIPPYHDIQWTLPAVAPTQPGWYETEWQLIYQAEDGRQETIGPPIGFVVTVVPEGTTPDVISALQNLIEQAKEEAQGRLETFWQNLQQAVLDELEAALRQLIPPELQCLFGLSIVFSNVTWLFRIIRKRRHG